LKTKTIVIILFCALVIFSARNYIKDSVLPFLGINLEENSENYTNEQQSAIDDFKNGVTSVFNLMKDGLFSLTELIDLGILDKETPMESLGKLIDNDESFSVSDIDIDSLSLENLNNEQYTLILKVFSGQMTMTELITSGKFTLTDLQNIGLFDAIMDNINNSES